MALDEGNGSILAVVAERVRSVRDGRGWSRRELAARSGLSLRFLARIEAGDGNLSVKSLDALARALGTSPDRLIRRAAGRHEVVTLVGLRGAGKSSVGPLLAERLGRPFIEMDGRILEAAGLPLDQIFELHGERYYRRLEHDSVVEILTRGEPAVVAAAGGVVNEPDTWRLLLDRTVVVWLRARPEDHWQRVVAQGDRRPMADNPAAMEELRSMLRAREPLYAAAPIRVETSGRSAEAVADAVVRELARSA